MASHCPTLTLLNFFLSVHGNTILLEPRLETSKVSFDASFTLTSSQSDSPADVSFEKQSYWKKNWDGIWKTRFYSLLYLSVSNSKTFINHHCIIYTTVVFPYLLYNKYHIPNLPINFHCYLSLVIHSVIYPFILL